MIKMTSAIFLGAKGL